MERNLQTRTTPAPGCMRCYLDDKLSIKKAVNFSNIYVKLLSRMTSRRCGAMLNLNWLVANQEGKLPNAVVGSSWKGAISLLPAFRFNFHCWLQLSKELTTDCAAASVSSSLRVLVRIKTSPEKCVITASLVNEELDWWYRTKRVMVEERNHEVNQEWNNDWNWGR